MADPDESELTAGVRSSRADYGFFTDTTLCIGCKACEVACKEWNRLPADGIELTGHSYDNTGALSATTWRHVAFVEQIGTRRRARTDDAAVPEQLADDERRLQALRSTPAAWRRARPARSSGPSSTRSWSSRTSATAAATASRPARSVWSS